ncbi:MAG: hypothetical protein IJW82_08250 [Clostridia bacterium]|nr:hypothetical protein [Clostridia bacterium]
MNNVLKVFSVKENGITYTFYNVSRKEFFYVATDCAFVFQRENAKMFILNIETCKSVDDFNNILNDFFACDEIKVEAI